MLNVNFGCYVFVIFIYVSMVLEIMFKVYNIWDKNNMKFMFLMELNVVKKEVNFCWVWD